MATPSTYQAQPYNGESDDTETGVAGNVEVNVTLKLVGSVAAVQADWATLVGTSLQSSAVLSHD